MFIVRIVRCFSLDIFIHLSKSHHHFTLVYTDYYIGTYIDQHKIYMRDGNLSGKCELWGF
jgi:hypothetical protein